MMYGSVFVSMIGIALPVLTGVWLIPKSDAGPTVNLAGREPNRWFLLWFIQSREWLNNGVRQWLLPGSSGPSSTAHHG